MNFIKRTIIATGIFCVMGSGLNAFSKTYDPLKIFTDKTCSQLRAGVTAKDIARCKDDVLKNAALSLLKGSYDAEFRVQEYRQYQHPDIMAKINKTNAYSLLDNATGIVAHKGQTLVVAVGNTNGDSVKVKIQNLLRPNGDGYDDGSFYTLTEGINRITPQNDGLVYVLYHGKEAHSVKKVKIHFLTGTVNGYFDVSKHEPSQWAAILNNTTYELIDVLGEKSHLTFPVDSLRKYTPDGAALVRTFDRIVGAEQEFSGLNKYNKQFNNRQYCHIVYEGYMYAPNYRTAYGVQTMRNVCDIKRLTGVGLWGPSHEIGHINQVRPGAKWQGLTEVTNNIFCLYVQNVFGQTTRMQKEVERPTGTYDDCWYERSMTDYFTKHLAHNANPINHCRLIPFWQLYLYFNKVKGQDFYADLFELIRDTPDPQTDGLCQLEFVMKASFVAKMNLIPFFEKYGFLTPIDIQVKDYGKKQFTVTAEQIANAKKEIEAKHYPTPDQAFWYICDNTVDFFKNPQPVTRGKVAVCNGNTFTMSGWNHVAAYELYRDGNLIFVSPLSSFTVEETEVKASDKLYAIAVDGTKVEVPFKWTENKAQIEQMNKRNSKYKNAYKR